MKNKLIIALIIMGAFVLFNNSVKAQNVGINATGSTPDASAGLDIDFSDKGLLIPRVALTATNSESPITSPTTSLLVYNTATTGTAPYNVFPGYYFWNGTIWQRFKTVKNRKFLTADVSKNNTTIGDVTGLSFPVEVGVTYKFKFFICFTASSGIGSRWTINGPTASTLRFYSSYPSSSTANAFYHQSAYDGAAVTTNPGSTTNNIAIIEGIINCSSSASEVIARFAAEGATITAKANVSFVEWEILE